MRLKLIQIGNKFMIEYTSFTKRQIFTFYNQKKLKKKALAAFISYCQIAKTI